MALALSVLGALLVVPAQAVLAEEADDTGSLERMAEYSEAEFAQEAAGLPVGLLEALDRDLGISGEQYLAEAEAALQAVDVVDSLEAAGVAVLGSRIEGTILTVNVESADDAAIVESVGAVAEFGEPEVVDLGGLDLSLAAEIYDGQGYYWETSTSGYQCSIGFNGYLVATGAQQLVTAGHCLEASADIEGSVVSMNLSSGPGTITTSDQLGSAIGLPVAGTVAFGTGDPGYDAARIAASAAGLTAKASAVTWGGGSGTPLSSAPRLVTGQSAGILGATLCKSGSRTGWSCGEVVDVDYTATIDDVQVNSVVAELCMLPGDSGGAGLIGTAAVGVSSWTSADTTQSTCSGKVYAGFFPMVSSGASVSTLYGSAWEVAASVPTPVITSSVMNPSALTGTLSSPSGPNQVSIYIDGSATPFATVSASSGSWSVPTAAVPAGAHTFTAVASYGTWSKSAPASGSFAVGFQSDRLQGSDRYETGVAVAKAAYGPGIPVLYVSTGANYPDALSAGPAAVHGGGPVLLVQPTSLSPAVSAAIQYFTPGKVIVLGAANSISETVFGQIRAIVPNTVRIAGSDRYDTSRRVTSDAFLNDTDPGGSSTVFIANGANFPDALSAGAAAASVDAPVLLVYGAATSVPADTVALIQALGATTITIAGSSASVSTGIQAQLDALPGIAVQRLGGSDRYETSRLLNGAYFSPTEQRVFIATGEGYPDALAGAALAGAMGAPLFTTPRTCLSPFTDMVTLKATRMTLLGGEPSLSSAVGALARCS